MGKRETYPNRAFGILNEKQGYVIQPVGIPRQTAHALEEAGLLPLLVEYNADECCVEVKIEWGGHHFTIGKLVAVLDTIPPYESLIED